MNRRVLFHVPNRADKIGGEVMGTFIQVEKYSTEVGPETYTAVWLAILGDDERWYAVRADETTLEPLPPVDRAFTLIELLVVIAVIALLLGLISSGLAKSRELSRDVACAEKLHDHSVSYQAYRNDHRGAVPMYPIDLCSDPDPMDPLGLRDAAWICPGATAYYRGNPGAINFLLDTQRGNYRGLFDDLSPAQTGAQLDRAMPGLATVVLHDAEWCYHGGKEAPGTLMRWKEGHMNQAHSDGHTSRRYQPAVP